jgi:thioredoxin
MKKLLTAICLTFCTCFLIAEEQPGVHADVYNPELQAIFEKNYLEAEDQSSSFYWIAGHVLHETGGTINPTQLIEKFKEEARKPEVQKQFLELYASLFNAEEIEQVYELIQNEVYMKLRSRIFEANYKCIELTQTLLQRLVEESQDKLVAKADILQVTEDNLQALMNSSCPVIIDVYTDWCYPCRNFAPLFKELNEEYGHRYQFAKLDGEAQSNLLDHFNIRGFPTIIFIKDGKEVGRHLGFLSKEKFVSKMKELFGE